MCFRLQKLAKFRLKHCYLNARQTHVVQSGCMLWFSDTLEPLGDAGWELELCLEVAQPTPLLQSRTSACPRLEGNLGNRQHSAICTPPAPRTRQYSTICTPQAAIGHSSLLPFGLQSTERTTDEQPCSHSQLLRLTNYQLHRKHQIPQQQLQVADSLLMSFLLLNSPWPFWRKEKLSKHTNITIFIAFFVF